MQILASQHRFLRHWPLGAMVVLWALSAIAFGVGSRSEALDEGFRLTVAVAALVLLACQWRLYRKNIGGVHLAFLSAVLFTLSLPAIWLGLNVVRFYTYDADNPYSTAACIHGYVIRVQDALGWLGILFVGVSIVLGISDLVKATVRNQRSDCR